MRFGRIFSAVMLTLVLLFLALPILTVIPISFSASPVFSFPPQGFSLRWYANIRNADSVLSALWLSAQIAFLSTCISLVIGTLAAIAIVRDYIPGGRAIATLMVAPLMVPGLVLGIAFLQAAREFGLRDAYATLLLAHVVVTLPFIMRTVLASLSLFDFTMVDAARMLGLSWPMALWKVLVPNILPGFMSGALFAFVASFDNYATSIFLTDARVKTLPIQMLNFLDESPDPSLAAMSAVVIAMTLVVLLVCDRIVGVRRLANM